MWLNYKEKHGKNHHKICDNGYLWGGKRHGIMRGTQRFKDTDNVLFLCIFYFFKFSLLG